MCAVADLLYARVYDRYAGLSGRRSLWYVRIGRQMLEHHRRECKNCREERAAAKSNWNAAEPARVTWRARKGEG